MRAVDKATNKTKITITASTNLSKDEVERMRKEAEANADADKKRRELIEARNMAESMLYTTEKMMKDARTSPTRTARPSRRSSGLAQDQGFRDLEGIKRAGDELATAAQKVGGDVQKQQNDASTVGGNPDAGTEPPK